ncbi:MAG: cytochrome c oxidase subunit II [Sandaracinaceae bacterium]
MGDENEALQNGYDATIQLPEGASTLAPYVDALYYEIFWISVIFFVAIVGAMVWFGWQFRRRKGVTSKPPGHHTAMELFWTFSPLILLAYMFHQGFDSYMMMTIPPETSINIRVRAYKWRWEFEQPNGMIEGELRVPVHQPVRMIMASSPTGPRPEDGAVLHSFFVPAFRVKRDIVPGMYTSLWFEATREGQYQIYCTEYCGTGHSRMLSNVQVMSQEGYDEYLRIGPQCPEEYEEDWQWGEQLFASNGCVACHNVEESAGAGVGPNLANVAGTMQPIEGGEPVMADAAYIMESIMEPQAQIVSGYTSAAMPAFNLPQTQLDALIAYVAHLSDEGGDLELTPHCGDAAEAAAAEAE